MNTSNLHVNLNCNSTLHYACAQIIRSDSYSEVHSLYSRCPGILGFQGVQSEMHIWWQNRKSTEVQVLKLKSKNKNPQTSCSTFFSLCIFECQYIPIRSDLLFSFLRLVHLRMTSFSGRHKSQFLAPVWYFCAFFVILHVTFVSLPASRSSCMNFNIHALTMGHRTVSKWLCFG